MGNLNVYFLEFFSSLYMQICKLGQKLRFFLHFYPKIPLVVRFWFLFVHSIILDTLIFKTLKKLFQSTAQRRSYKHFKFCLHLKTLDCTHTRVQTRAFPMEHERTVTCVWPLFLSLRCYDSACFGKVGLTCHS